jgi:FtsH-binding integral membrane protein
MAIALLVTAVTAYGFASTGLTSAIAETGLLIAIPLGTVVLVFVLSMLVHKMPPLVAIAVFVLYAFLVGVSLSAIFFVFELGSIFQAFFGAAAMFGVMSVYGLFTKRDLTSWGTFLHMAVIGLFIANLITFFIGGLDTGIMNYIISSIGVLVFVGLTAYDTQKIKKMSAEYGDSIVEADYIRLSIHGALHLYLDFINIFLYLLRLFGGRR